MKTKWLLLTMALFLTLGTAVPVLADHDIELPINGDFQGNPVGYSPAPGWTLTSDGGQARVLPTSDLNEFALELRAAPNQSQSVLSELHRLPGHTLKLELKLRGKGSASAGYEAFDNSGQRLVSADREMVMLSHHEQKIKRYFPLPAHASFVRILLTAEAGSAVIFRDVEAEVSYGRHDTMAPPPGPAPMPAPPAHGVIPAPQPGPGVMPAPQPGPGHLPPPTRYNPLQNDRFYEYKHLKLDDHYEVTLPPGSDIEFELEENPKKGKYWQVVSYDPNICRVKLKHDRDHDFFSRRDKAEIELKALRPGSTVVIFTCESKTFTVHFHSR